MELRRRLCRVIVPYEYKEVYKWTVVVVVAWLTLLNLACEAIKWDVRNAVPIKVYSKEWVEIYGTKSNWARDLLQRIAGR